MSLSVRSEIQRIKMNMKEDPQPFVGQIIGCTVLIEDRPRGETSRDCTESTKPLDAVIGKT